MLKFIFSFIVLISFTQENIQLGYLQKFAQAKSKIMKPLRSNSLKSSYCLIIQNDVEVHLQRFHSENSLAIKGVAFLILNPKEIRLKPVTLIENFGNSKHELKLMDTK